MVVTVRRCSRLSALAAGGSRDRDSLILGQRRRDERNVDVPFGFHPFPSPPQGGNGDRAVCRKAPTDISIPFSVLQDPSAFLDLF